MCLKPRYCWSQSIQYLYLGINRNVRKDFILSANSKYKSCMVSDHSPSSHSSSSDSSGPVSVRFEDLPKSTGQSSLNSLPSKPLPILPLNPSHFAPQTPLFLTPPTMGGAISAVETLQEPAAKLLFMSVKWAKNIPSFLQLPFRDQAILLEESWCELFVLSAAQWSLPFDTGMC